MTFEYYRASFGVHGFLAGVRYRPGENNYVHGHRHIMCMFLRLQTSVYCLFLRLQTSVYCLFLRLQTSVHCLFLRLQTSV